MLTPKELILRPKPVPLSEFDLTQSNPSRIIACLSPPSEAVRAGHAIALPNNTFDIRQVLKQLPSHFQPDLVSLSARVMSFLPRGLHALNCPTVMKLGDTFHLGDGGLSQTIRYCQTLNCDYHWTYQGAQHLHFFAEAGLSNVFWLPGSIVLNYYIPPASDQKSYDVIFRGSKSELHHYRNRLLNQLCNSDININVQTKDYISSLQDYVKSHIVINTSLNGDLNRRVFEVLMAGGFLLTDRIRPQTGLFHLFEEGTHFECYGDETELLEKIQFYLAHPDQAAQIAAAGHQQFLKHYLPQAIQQKLYNYIFNDQIDSLFRLKQDQRSLTSANLYTRIKLYEVIQELHRLDQTLNILCYHTYPEIAIDLADLPRTCLTYIVAPINSEKIRRSLVQAKIKAYINLQSSLPADSSFQIAIVDGTQSTQSLQDCIRAILPHLNNLGFLIVANPHLIAIQQLNDYLEAHYCFPIELSVKLSSYLYPLALENHGIIYQKILPKGYSQTATPMADLTIAQISSAKVLIRQLRHLPIVRLLTRALRPTRSLLHRALRS